MNKKTIDESISQALNATLRRRCKRVIITRIEEALFVCCVCVCIRVSDCHQKKKKRYDKRIGNIITSVVTQMQQTHTHTHTWTCI